MKSDRDAAPPGEPLPQYLLDRSNPSNAKALSSAVKNKRKEAAAKFSVPLPKVKGISEEEMFKAVKTGKKTAKKSWKRMITKPTFGRMKKACHINKILTCSQSVRTLRDDPSNMNALSGLWDFATRKQM